MSSRALAWFLPVSAVLLVAVTVWEYRNAQARPARQPIVGKRPFHPVGPALQFELYDSENRPVRLSRYLGRHRIFLAFLAKRARFDQDGLIARLRQLHPAMSRNGIIVLVVSQGLPQEARQAFRRGGDVAFPVLSDVGGPSDSSRLGSAADAWGLGHGEDAVPRTVLFLIDRGGRVAWDGTSPRPLENPQAVLDQFEESR